MFESSLPFVFLIMGLQHVGVESFMFCLHYGEERQAITKGNNEGVPFGNNILSGQIFLSERINLTLI